MEDKKEVMKMTYTGVIRQNKQKVVHVRFEREADGKIEFAEGIVPGGMIEKSIGFTLEECKALEFYLAEHEEEIFKEAKKINDKEFFLH